MNETIGRFQIRRELGRGAQSAVYLAYDPQLQREVAIKTLHFAKSDTARNLALLSEARAVSALKHPSIVPIYDAGEEGGDPFLVFEYVEGPSLAELIRRDGRLAPALAADMMRQVLDAVANAHAHGIIHRDLKPSNILIDASGKPRVMDFGIAIRQGEAAGDGLGLAGTPAYMAPEYIDRQDVSPRVDVWAAGLVLLEMITGRRVISAESLPQIAYQVTSQPVAIPSDAGIDDKLSAIILKACARDPALRLQDATQMKSMLDDYLGAAATPIELPGDTEAQKQGTLEFLMRRMKHKSDFPALSDSVSAINKLTSSDKESINKLSNTILKDYGLTNKIMRLVNSAYYRTSGGGSISTVSRAVVVLGFDAVRNIAITVLLFEHLQDKANAKDLKEAFLRANLAGTLARDASRKFMAREAEEGYICALFHCLGQLLAQYYFPEEVIEIRKVMLQQNCSEETAATRVLGIGFSDLGIGIARYWGFPPPIVASLHPLEPGPVRKPATHDETLRVLAGFANELCDAIAASPNEDRVRILHEVNKRFSAAMPFTDKQLHAVLEQSFDEMKELASVLHVNLKQSPFARQVKQWVSGGRGVCKKWRA
jgi:eukaryotic-like serine/threonine-protein kinase